MQDGFDGIIFCFRPIWVNLRDSITQKCEAALGSIIDGLDDDKDGRVNIDRFVHFMASHDIIIDPDEVQEMQDLADEKIALGKNALKTFAKHSCFWNDLEHQAEDIFRESNKAAEFQQAIKCLSETQIRGIFEKYDESFDGKLTYQNLRISWIIESY